MSENKIYLKIYSLKEKCTEGVWVEQISDNIYKALSNSIFSEEVTFGSVFETRINKEGEHEIMKIISDSDYIIKRFFLTTEFKESEYLLLGDEIIKIGGFWQVDFGSMATVNISKNRESDLNEVFKMFNFDLTSMK